MAPSVSTGDGGAVLTRQDILTNLQCGPSRRSRGRNPDIAWRQLCAQFLPWAGATKGQKL